MNLHPKKIRLIKLVRITMAKRMPRTLAATKEHLQRRRHDRLGNTGRWLGSVVRGWRQYDAVPGNDERLKQFDDEVQRLWLRQDSSPQSTRAQRLDEGPPIADVSTSHSQTQYSPTLSQCPASGPT